MATAHALLLVLLLVAAGATFAARDLGDANSLPAAQGKPAPYGIPGVPAGYDVPGIGGGWGAGYGGPGGGYAHGGVEVPTVVCSEMGPCYGKKVTCPKRCFWSYSRSGNGGGGGGGGGSCTIDCKAKCTASC